MVSRELKKDTSGYWSVLEAVMLESRGGKPNPNQRCSILIIAGKGSKRMDGAIDSFLNREAESKLGFSW